MENGPEQEERMEAAPEPGAEANSEEPSAGLEPSAGTMELQHEGGEEAPAASRRHTEVLALPKVDRREAPATPAVRPGETSTPATGTKSRTERKQEKKAARKEEKRNKRAEKSARKAEKAEAEKPDETPPKTPVRRKLDAAMETAGSIESVLLLEREYKALQRDPSHRPNFYFLIDRLISNLRHIPRTVFGPPAGEEEMVKLTKLREEEEAEDAEAVRTAAARMEEADEGSASRKRKLDELEEKKRVLEEENLRKQKELEDKARRIRVVEEAEGRAREQRSKNPKLQVPVAAEKTEKGETWFERKATELVESYIQAYGPQQKKSKEAAETYASACKDSERAQENFISALQKTQETAEQLQKSMGKALEAAIEFGREEERAQLYTQAKEKCSRPEVPRVKARPQIPAGLQEKLRKEKAQKEEESSKSGKKEGAGVPTSTQPGPFWGARVRVQPAEEEPGKEWRERISEDTWKAGRTIRSDEKYLDCTYYPFSPEWQEKVRKELLDLAHRGFATNEDGELYPTRKFAWQLQSNREFMSINNSLDSRRKYFPLRNIICERFQHEKDDYQRFYPAIAFADYGAVSSQISEINAKKYKDAKMRSPEEYPEIEPPADEREDRPVLSSAEAVPYAASKKAAKPSDPEQSMASHSEALLEMQDSAKKRRAKLLEKESKEKAIDVDEEEPASKKARGKGHGSPSGIWTKEPLPAGHWQDRPRRESLPSDSKEAKEALRQKLEEHKKEQLEEYHKKKLRETFEKHLSKEAGSKEARSDAPAAATASSKEEPKPRTEAMEAAGSPGSIGADVPPVAAQMQPEWFRIVEVVTQKDIGETSAPTDIQYVTLKLKNMHQEFPEVFPLASEEEGEAGFTDSEGEVEKGDDFGLCKGCLNCILEKIVIFACNGSFDMKESLMTSKPWKIQREENTSGLSFTWTWNARGKRNKKRTEFGWYVEKSFMMSLNGLLWMIPMAMTIGEKLERRTHQMLSEPSRLKNVYPKKVRKRLELKLNQKNRPNRISTKDRYRMEKGDRGQSQSEQLEEVLDMLATDLSVSNGGRVSQEEDVFHWDEHDDLTAVEGEDIEYEDLVEEEMEDAPEYDQGESPPEVSPEELDSMDQEAAVEELNRLSKIGVIEEFAESGASGSEKRMDLREVYDWRYRDGKWRRRCRIVAREYRAGATSTAETFSPTASNAAARLVLILHLLNPTWVILVLDIKDAYLQVPQQEEVLVTISDWMKKAYNIGEGIVWRLKRCLPDWVRENVISIGTVKTVLNVADLNTKKLTYARRAFLTYFLSQVEYSEGEEIIHTGVDEYERYEQEKKLKEYVSSGQVKDLVRLIQVFSVIKPATAVWIKEEGSYSQQPGSTDAMEEAKYSRTEVAMLVTVLLLVIPYVWIAVKRIHSEWTRITMIGKVRINSSSKNYIFHRTTCAYVQGRARNGYFIHLDYDVAVEQGYRPCYVCFPEAKKVQTQTDEDDGWELTSESTENTESDGCTPEVEEQPPTYEDTYDMLVTYILEITEKKE
ncbi:hypothetical protein AK812_SmicGene42834 [Symbiodinium microadriaticum]|uniref:Reverse transcriptase Ty1/copia-type domain-containing protein n=1 Tax=Symbiodinium microadriaticum TaxID=2951 RepID=A0A1Q9C2K9_SYMMI|nr:hypothetical protein AK812_SmicGene42834 [Symbiodinium microadriaticum]